MRKGFDATEHARAVASRLPEDDGQPSLFATPSRPSWSERWTTLSEEQREAQRERWRERLLPIVDEFCETRGPEGFMACDVESRGITDGILPLGLEERDPRVFSFIGPWLRRLARARRIFPLRKQLADGGWIHAKGKSDRPASKGNPGYRYVGARWAA